MNKTAEIIQLKKALKDLSSELKELRFKIENPPQFKVGDKINKEFICTSCEIEYVVSTREHTFSLYHYIRNKYNGVNIKTGETKLFYDEISINIP
jgi:hypothetical protein